ncbi:MAG: sigma-70 family RNA polymerase sigma factor [Anaerotignum sp.]
MGAAYGGEPSMTDHREKELIAKAKQGDMLAFEELILRHEKIVYNVALRMMNHSEDAKDISQEVFLKAYKNMKNFDERSMFSTWLYRITTNTCIDEMRKRKGKQSYSLEEELENEEGSMQRQIADEGETPEESLLREERKSELLQALDTLSEEHKAAVILRDIRGLSYEEVAEIVDLPMGTVKSRISRARNQLKNEILKIRERNEGKSRHKKGKEGRP